MRSAVKCDEFVKSQLLPEAKRLDLSPAASNLVIPQSIHTGGLALNYNTKSHYASTGKNLSTSVSRNLAVCIPFFRAHTIHTCLIFCEFL